MDLEEVRLLNLMRTLNEAPHDINTRMEVVIPTILMIKIDILCNLTPRIPELGVNRNLTCDQEINTPKMEDKFYLQVIPFVIY
jgi:hypothetical protein